MVHGVLHWDTMAQANQSEAFADGTPLVELFGKPGRTKIITVLVDEREWDLSISEIAEQAGVARSTVYDHIDWLVELGVVAEARETAQGTRYTLNEDSEIATKLYKLDGLVLQRLLDMEDKVE